jgi:hypothetical protein
MMRRALKGVICPVLRKTSLCHTLCLKKMPMSQEKLRADKYTKPMRSTPNHFSERRHEMYHNVTL